MAKSDRLTIDAITDTGIVMGEGQEISFLVLASALTELSREQLLRDVLPRADDTLRKLMGLNMRAVAHTMLTMASRGLEQDHAPV